MCGFQDKWCRLSLSDQNNSDHQGEPSPHKSYHTVLAIKQNSDPNSCLFMGLFYKVLVVFFLN